MDLDWIWKAILIVLGGTILLRGAGRKSISQMTLVQTVIMIGIGSLLIQPLAGKNIWITLGVGGLLILTLILLEYLQVKFDFIENLITGKSKVLIENGVLIEKNLKKLRLTVDQLEMNLRQKNVAQLKDVQWATLEPNGQIGFELKQQARPITLNEFNILKQDLERIKSLLDPNYSARPAIAKQPKSADELFTEVARKPKNEPPEHLQ